MHLYYIDAKLLEKKLNSFAGGQFQMKTRDWIFRGEIEECIALSDKRIKISFSWLCERHFFFDSSWTLQPKWSLLTAPSGLSRYLDVEWRYFYVQTDEDRLKMKGQLGEICHFFRKTDHTNLVQCGDEFIPYCDIYKLELWKAIILLLKPNCG